MELDIPGQPYGENKNPSLSRRSSLPYPAIHKFFHSRAVLIRIIGQSRKQKKRVINTLLSALASFSRACQFFESHCFGAEGFGVVVAGRGWVGAGADGADGTGGAMPDEVLYAVTTACVTSILGPIHITLLC
jgi:hypothetical protein